MATNKQYVTKHYAYYFPIYLFITQFAGIFFMALIFLTVVLYMGGYDYVYESKRGQNYHMILAPLTFVYMNGQGILLFRLMKNVKTQTVKVFHTLIHTTSVLGSVLAIYAMWNGKENPYTPYQFYQHTPTEVPRPTKYTPIPLGDMKHIDGVHTSLGYLTVIFCLLAYFCGFLLHLIKVSLYYKNLFSGLHGFLGTYALLVATMTAVAGVVTVYNDQRVFWFTRYPKYSGEYQVGYYCSLCGLTFSWVILYVVLNPHFEWIPVGPI